jgi:hypothetical protein
MALLTSYKERVRKNIMKPVNERFQKGIAVEEKRITKLLANLMETSRSNKMNQEQDIIENTLEPFSLEIPSRLVIPQPPPIENSLPAVWDLVIHDMEVRDKDGFRKYGTRLQPFNGRDSLIDAYQEALDLCVYLRQAIYERDNT